MTKNQRLYNELRKFVDIKKVLDYDNEFFDNKKRSYKFMIPFLEKYINIKLVRNKITDPKAHSHLVDLHVNKWSMYYFCKYVIA